MIVVTGGAGFIGSNLVHALNGRGEHEIVVADDLSDGKKCFNLAGASIADYVDKDDLIAALTSVQAPPRVIFHLGACADTAEWDGRYMMRENHTYSKALLAYAQQCQVPLIYASSASVYGGSQEFIEHPRNEKPLNVYGFSKLTFDNYVRSKSSAGQVVGLRFFNVYGPREFHKGAMASVALHLYSQLQQGSQVCLFEGSDGYGPGEQRRDFIYVGDVCDVLLWCWDAGIKGIFNVGTGRAQTFNEVAQAVLDWHGRGSIAYIKFPEHLRGHYQSFTRADLSALRGAGYEGAFLPVQEGVRRYLDWLQQNIDASAL
ncbi:MAG: ADP-glyceromanno-heptose 6-epimerase [Gammaproteobacteria bacterium]|nr:ADP-glyceromanno-heptose 6-epimerase [Gammaproteobacteria bacterium]